ncbi:type VII secretion target [Amycolatopsis sp. YIM 10]|uniref:type VII secretion target n=1 Tax=Amycolatopsis sp. YIM 10 TaxID=2653857 RepID=UPI0012A9F6AB|nr:hypothetical protein YIM_28760 [Amycolatopsis sp. YIM 10]
MSYEVEPEDLIAHASHLDGVTDRLNTALDAAKTVSMDDSAYGLLCSFLPPIVNPMEEKGMEAIGAAVEGVETTAGNVRKAAESYRESDKAHVEPLKKFQADAEGTKVVELAGSSGGGGGGGGGDKPSSWQKPALPNEDATPAQQGTQRPMPFQGGEGQDVTPAQQGTQQPLPSSWQKPALPNEDATPAQQGTQRPMPFETAQRVGTVQPEPFQAAERQDAIRPEPFQAAERQDAIRPEPFQAAERQDAIRPEPFQAAERQDAIRPEPFQAAERPSFTPAQQGEPMFTAAQQGTPMVTPALQGEPVATPAHEAVQRPEPFQAAEHRVAEDVTPAQHSNRII